MQVIGVLEVQVAEQTAAHQGRTNDDPLLLSAGQVKNAAIQQVLDTEALGHSRDTAINLFSWKSHVFGREGKFIGDVRVEVLGFRVLEYAAEQRGEPVDWHGLHVHSTRGLAAGKHTMGKRGDKSVDHARIAGLAATARPAQHNALAFRNGQRDVA